MKFISADFVLPISSEPIANGVIQLDENNTVIRVGKREDFPTVDIHNFSGIILPGFINAHCHLELSHMQGICETGTGLIAFISKVVSLRDFDRELILDSIIRRDKEMFEAGIQAVGDICNKTDTASCKEESPIHYYSFVEMFDLLQPSLTASTIETYSQVFNAQSDKGHNKKSLAPHAPYSVTPALFQFINDRNPEDSVSSIHMQETRDEDALFQDGSGGFPAFYKNLGLSLDHFEPRGLRSMDYTLNHMAAGRPYLFVHNTQSTREDIEKAHSWSDKIYWVTCPNANMYIENALPDYRNFLDTEARVCLGTDSIMSNWQLSIWEELKTIRKHQSFIPISELLRWATINGARALQYDDLLGSIEPGKRPGLVNVELSWRGEDTVLDSSVARRIV